MLKQPGDIMKHSMLIPICAAMLVVFGGILIAMSFGPVTEEVYHTVSSKYCWYVMPQGEGVQPIVSDNETFRDNYDVIYLGSKDKNTIWLTFDVGYDNGNADKILDALKNANVQAAFFICGNVIDTCPELVRRMHSEGHLVLNHTDKHTDLSDVSKETITRELTALEDKFFSLTGDEMKKIVRPPEGNYSEDCLKTLTDMGYTTMFWSFAYKDWLNDEQPSPEKAMDTIISRAHPGMIALLHSNSATNALILEDAISALKQKGYEFGSFNELLQ